MYLPVCSRRVWFVSIDNIWGGVEGGVTIKMVNIMLSKGVGRRQEEKVRVLPKMLLFIQWVCSLGAVYRLCTAQVSLVLWCLDFVLLVISQKKRCRLKENMQESRQTVSTSSPADHSLPGIVF